jgi:hypothetical protein
VRARSQADLDALVDRLAAGLPRAPDAETHGQVAQKLMFSHSPRILPILIESMYGPHGGFWEGEALVCYLAHVPERERKAAVLRVATQRGLASNMQFVLASLGVTAAEIQPVIERSLEPANRAAWAHGALAAQIYGHDRFTARLVALASDPASGAQHQAMSALALNRNDEAIRTLRGLLAGPDAQSRRLAEEAIRTAYVYRGDARGRPLRPDDFDRSLQRPAPPPIGSFSDCQARRGHLSFFDGRKHQRVVSGRTRGGPCPTGALPGRAPRLGGASRAAFRRRLRDPVDARLQPDALALGPHELVLRDLRPGEGRAPVSLF